MKTQIKIPPIKKIIFFGGGKLMLNCAALAAGESIPTAIFSAQRHADERIDTETNLTLKEAARQRGINFYTENDINKSKILSWLAGSSTVGLGFGETYTFNQKTIKMFGCGLYDFMVIPLPRYRGGAHFTWQILNNDRKGCWNIQIINEDMVPGVTDTGGIIMKMPYTIKEKNPIPADYFKSSEKAGLMLFKKFLLRIRNGGKFHIQTLSESKSTYYPRLYTNSQAFINWDWTLEEIYRFTRAFDEPYAGALSFIDGRKCHLKSSRIVKDNGRFHPFMAGLIYRIYKNEVYVCATGGGLAFGRITDDKGRNIIKNLKPGLRFRTPHKFLEKALDFRAEYTATGLKK